VLRAGLRVTVEAPSLAGPVLTRIVRAQAADAGFSVDRLSDAELLADALAAATVGDAERGLDVGLASAEHGIELRIGPLPVGEAERLLMRSAVGDLGSMVERLADEVRTEVDGHGRLLIVRIAR
jgi:hypothetical protein